MSIRSKIGTNSKRKRRTLKRQRGGNGNQINNESGPTHGKKCITKKQIVMDNRGDYLICKKSKQLLGRKLKSSLKKKNGTRSLGKYGKKLENKDCMEGLCWHRLSMKDKIMYRKSMNKAKAKNISRYLNTNYLNNQNQNNILILGRTLDEHKEYTKKQQEEKKGNLINRLSKFEKVKKSQKINIYFISLGESKEKIMNDKNQTLIEITDPFDTNFNHKYPQFKNKINYIFLDWSTRDIDTLKSLDVIYDLLKKNGKIYFREVSDIEQKQPEKPIMTDLYLKNKSTDRPIRIELKGKFIEGNQTKQIYVNLDYTVEKFKILLGLTKNIDYYKFISAGTQLKDNNKTLRSYNIISNSIITAVIRLHENKTIYEYTQTENFDKKWKYNIHCGSQNTCDYPLYHPNNVNKETVISLTKQ